MDVGKRGWLGDCGGGVIQKATKPFDFIAFVPHTRVELVIYCVRGSCPGPLDECGVYFVEISLLKSGAKVRLFFELTSFSIKKNALLYLTYLEHESYN